MASIVKRGKSYSVVYYVGKKQLWESGLSYAAAKAFKAKIEMCIRDRHIPCVWLIYGMAILYDRISFWSPIIFVKNFYCILSIRDGKC